MGDSGNYNYNSRFADNLKVVVKQGGWELLDTNPDIIPGTPSCFVVEYDFIRDGVNDLYRLEMRVRYNGGSINIDMYRGIVDLILGNTFAPMIFD